MIFDTFENMKAYEKTVPALAKIEEFINEFKRSPKEDGKYPIDGDALFASVQTYTSKDPAAAKTEAHRAYADVQCVISGTEEMLVSPLYMMKLKEEKYSSGKDVAFYEGELVSRTVLSAGSFALLFPQDAHCPGVMHEKPETIKKIVFKVKL